MNQTKAAVLAQSALDVILGDLKQEIVLDSTAVAVGNTTVYEPIYPATSAIPSPMSPIRCTTTLANPNLIRISSASAYPRRIDRAGNSDKSFRRQLQQRRLRQWPQREPGPMEQSLPESPPERGLGHNRQHAEQPVFLAARLGHGHGQRPPRSSPRGTATTRLPATPASSPGATPTPSTTRAA